MGRWNGRRGYRQEGRERNEETSEAGNIGGEGAGGTKWGCCEGGGNVIARKGRGGQLARS